MNRVMRLEVATKLIDDLIKEDLDNTIKDFIELQDEIIAIETCLINNKDKYTSAQIEAALPI